MPPKDKYADPALRQKVKDEIQQSDKGGEPGQWSARKVRDVLQASPRILTSVIGPNDGEGVQEAGRRV